MLKKFFGYITIFNVNNHRDEYLYYNRPYIKIRWIGRWVTPLWLQKHLETIEFNNIYEGTPDDYRQKYTCLIFSGSKNLYWIYFRKKPGDYSKTGDWKWCLKFLKSPNDHCCCG